MADDETPDTPITDPAVIETALTDSLEASAPTLPRCDCSALAVPHVHAPSGPEPLAC